MGYGGVVDKTLVGDGGVVDRTWSMVALWIEH